MLDGIDWVSDIPREALSTVIMEGGGIVRRGGKARLGVGLIVLGVEIGRVDTRVG